MNHCDTLVTLYNRGIRLCQIEGCERDMEPARIRIKQAFRSLLSKEAFSKISVAEICREAKLSRVTFYLWYDGKDTLLNDCFQDIVNEGMHYFSQFRTDSSVSSVKTDCHALLETIFYLASEYHEFASHLFIDSGREDQFLYSRFNSIVMQKVTELMKEHSGQIASPLTLNETASFLAGGLASMIREDLKSGLPSSTVHEHASAMLDHVLSTGLFISDC
jgi:AcrR family transcriptional regulator